ncbi:MAG: IclR family transcriptional regulator [Streptosporangiaceae bacterium]
MDILERLAMVPGGIGVTDLARSLTLDKGHAHRLLRALEQKGYVQQDPGTKLFSATAQVIALAGQVLRHVDILAGARPVLRDLLDSTGESVHLARRVPQGGVYIAQERPAARISVETQIGSSPELHCTATGKALLAFDDSDWPVLLTEPFPRHTPRTITTMAGLRTELQRTRDRGYALDDQELSAEVRCVAAPVFDLMARPIGCVGLSGPVSRMTDERVGILGPLVAAAAAEITHRAGGRVPGRDSLTADLT